MISAASLRTNNDYSVKQSPSFGKSEGHKNHKARNIAIAVGVAGATAVTAYAFRGQLARIGFVKDMLGYAGKALGKTLDMGIKARDFIRDKQPVQKIKTAIPEIKDKVASNEVVKTVTSNVRDYASKLFGKIKSANIKEEVKDLGSAISEKVSEGVKKVKDIDIKAEAKDIGKKVSEGVKKVKVKGSAETVNQIKTEFSERLTQAKEVLSKSRTRASVNEALTSIIESAQEAIEKMKTIRKR